MQAGTAGLALASLVYLGVSVGFLRDLFAGRPGPWDRWRSLLWSGLGLHSVGLLLLTVSLGHFPISGIAETTGSLAWAIVLMHQVIGPRWNTEVLGALTAPVAFTLTVFCLAALRLQASVPTPSSWVVLHVISVLLGYGAFTLASLCAALYVVQARLLKRKSIGGLFMRLPPLGTLDRVAYRLILLGFLPMALGVASGMLLMHGESGSWWNWEPKLTLVALTGLVYLVYLHARLLAGWQGRRVNMLLLVAFFCVLISYLAPGDFHRF